MKVKQLIEAWEESASELRTANEYRVRLSIHDAAKLSALQEMFPGRSESDLITDLLSAALDDLEAAFPYVQGQRIVAEDEHGDPIYEDVGSTPRFQEITRKHLQRLQRQLQEP
ncbi:hypothetical protein J2T57_000998 [Natronocella acetinitrilica]|uniref:Type 1 pili tip component n=1 Tax=Natronocella acetinitrilica TaxID=414046 RepID=A0AAE3G1N4_9GAMM|nr:type 1 pili tip component [Natronocella acetinitrilica]MCP1673899.1 hypothetical protein [Natronocella acetinitrilica]